MRGATTGIRAVKVCLFALVFSLTVLPEGSVLRPSVAKALPPGFQVNTVISGLDTPTAVAFSPDGRVFVAEKSGIIKVYTDLNDPTPTTFADLSTNVYNFFDRGLLGLELHPNFPAQPYVYALYTYDGDIGGPAPKWGTPGVLSDPCPDPPGASPDGCPAAARLSRLTASGDVMTGPEQVLIEDWCQQSPTHSIGTVTFGPDGALYVGAGDAASPLDWGQYGDPVDNPCGDPPGGVGGAMSPPTAEGGALRVQDLRTPSDPTTLDGTIIRVDPITGAALPDNPLFGSSDANARRVIAYGLRNPFRFAFRPGTSEIWAGDVGQATWEEINRITNPTDAVVENFGWPCYEGSPRMPGWDTRDFTICENLYNEPPATAAKAPYFAYRHSQPVFPGDTCPTGSGVVSAVGFYEGGSYPDSYDGALFFADYGRSCIWAMPPSQNGLPDPNLAEVFVDFAGYPVDIETGPAGDLFYVDIGLGRIRRIQYFSSNQPPTAVIAASSTSGPVPLTVNFDGTGSTDPENGALTYEWDLDGDGAYDDSTAPQPSFTYTSPGNVTVRLRVTDPLSAQDTESILISVGNSPPTAVLDQPLASFTWHVGETVSFAGQGTDPESGNLPPSAMSWEVILHHCPSTCHDHPYQSFEDVDSGSFAAPDHEYPSHLEVRYTVTDPGGLSDTTSVLIYPETTTITMGSSPSGLSLDLNGENVATPFTRTVIVGSTNALNAPSPQSLSGSSYEFVSWSDGGAQTHNVVVSAPATYTATYTLATTVGVSIETTKFNPKNVAIALGQIVRWTNTSAVNHNVTDTTGMGYFGSGTIAPAGTYQFTFAAAGNFPYRSTLGPSGMTGSVSVPGVVAPTTGGTSTTFTVTWASAPLPSGYVVDVQIRRPGTSTWTNWRLNQTGTSTTFIPDAGTGTYEFRARLKRTGVGSAAYSTPFAIVVT